MAPGGGQQINVKKVPSGDRNVVITGQAEPIHEARSITLEPGEGEPRGVNQAPPQEGQSGRDRGRHGAAEALSGDSKSPGPDVAGGGVMLGCGGGSDGRAGEPAPGGRRTLG